MRGRDQKADSKRRAGQVAKPKTPKLITPGHKMTFQKMTPERQEAYLVCIENGATFAGAAKRVGCSRYYVREFGKSNPEFARKVEEARERGFEKLTEDIEFALAKAAKAGNIQAAQVWLYNRAPHRWKDMRSFRLHTVDDVLSILPPALAKELRPLFGVKGTPSGN